MDSLVIGTVAANYDKNHPGKVQVSYTAFGADEKTTAWMPVASWYAGKDYGAYFLPEKDEQVIVGFIGGDAHCGIVLGSLWNSKNTIPKNTIPKNTVDDENKIRCLITKGGHNVVLKYGDEGKITIKSKTGHIVEIDEKAKTVKLATSDGNQQLLLDEKNKTVDMKSGDKLNIEAKNISIKGTVTMAGPSIKIESYNKMEMKGNQTELNGSTTKIIGQSAEFTGAAYIPVRRGDSGNPRGRAPRFREAPIPAKYTVYRKCARKTAAIGYYLVTARAEGR